MYNRFVLVSIIVLILFVSNVCNQDHRLLKGDPDFYGFWFPEKINWTENVDIIDNNGNSQILSSMTSQFYYYYFDSMKTERIWSTITFEYNVDSFTIAADKDEQILFASDSTIYQISKISDTLLLVNNLKYRKTTNIRE